MAARKRLERTQLIPRSRAEVFSFFARAENLQAITPDFLRFEIATPLPIAMREGARIEYRIRLFGAPLRWLTEITEWRENERFVDVQLRGPYAHWHHSHEFTDAPGGTLMRDVVEYQLPFGVLGVLAHELWVQHTLKRIFDHRAAIIAGMFAPRAA